MRFLLAVILFATPLMAQSLDPRYEPVGNFDGDFGDATLGLKSLFDTEKDRSAVKLRDASGFATLSVSASAIGDDGKPTSPSVSFTIGPIGAGGDEIRSDVFFADTTGYYIADNDIGGRVGLSDYEQTETSVSFSVEALLQPVKRGDDGFEVDDARAGKTISGTFLGAFTDVD